MYKKRYYINKGLNKAFETFNETEKANEDINKEKLDKTIKAIIKHDDPIKKLNIKKEKESRIKPIDTRILLKGFI
jgi:hypothetical protein